MTISVQARGTQFIRSLLARAAVGDKGDPTEFARNRFGDRAAIITRAAVAAGGIGSGAWAEVLGTPEHGEFFAAVQQASIVGKLPLRAVPLNTRVTSVSASGTAFWTAGGQPKPLSKAAFAGSTLLPLKVAILYCLSKELSRFAGAVGEQRVREDFIRVLAEELDRSFIDASNAGVAGEQPASITFGAPSFASSGNPNSDLEALFATFSGDLASATIITDPQTALEFRLARDSNGAFQHPDASPRGGSLCGLPLVTSRSSPRDSGGGQVAIVDAAGVSYGAEGVRTATSEQTSLSMRDDPSSPIEQVSMFQVDSVACLAELSVNWRVERPGSVAVITDVDYSVS